MTEPTTDIPAPPPPSVEPGREAVGNPPPVVLDTPPAPVENSASAVADTPPANPPRTAQAPDSAITNPTPATPVTPPPAHRVPPPSNSDMGHPVTVPTFSGPLDLLLYLVKENEVDILNIPIALIAQQYLDYLNRQKTLDIGLAGDFLVLATHLMEIKSRMLLPEPPAGDEEEEDPRGELVKQLLVYQRYKEAALFLEGKFLAREKRFARGFAPPPADEGDGTPLVLHATAWDLTVAFARLLRETAFHGGIHIFDDRTPIETYMVFIQERLGKTGELRFTDLFDEGRNRIRIIGTLLALLELVRQAKVRVWIANGDEIRLRLADPAVPPEGSQPSAAGNPPATGIVPQPLPDTPPAVEADLESPPKPTPFPS
ncbi:MAG: segregation/condensation protein A [Planctomycetota bacterium]